MANKRIRRKRDKVKFARMMASGESWSYTTTAPSIPNMTVENLLELQEKLRTELLKHTSEKYRLTARFLNSGPLLPDPRILIKSFAE